MTGNGATRGSELRRLSDEHRRCLRACHCLRLASSGHGSIDEAVATYLKTWRELLSPHCRTEEEVLLPELVARVSETDALIVFTTGDHLMLRRLARELEEGSGEELRSTARRLARRLHEHVRFEERTLFPALEATLGPERLSRLAEELEPDADGPDAGRGMTRRSG